MTAGGSRVSIPSQQGRELEEGGPRWAGRLVLAIHTVASGSPAAAAAASASDGGRFGF
jgi:hypothetical protein